MPCICKKILEETQISWDYFIQFWTKCSALNEILVPEEVFNRIEPQILDSHNIAKHRLHTYLALERGRLFRMTSPIHDFIMEGVKPNSNLTTQYRNDLQEKWIIENDALRRHQKARIFQGKLYELICASWLREKCWKITNLEALGGEWDIEGNSADGIDNVVEVKFFGELDSIFEANLTQNPTTLSPYDAVNYLLFRVCEAAKKLSESCKDKSTKRMVLIAISNQTRLLFDTPLAEDWINWECPSFLRGSDDWQNFVKHPKRNNFLAEPNRLPKQIHEIQIIAVAAQENYELEKMKTISF